MKNYGKEGRKGDVGLTSCNGGYIEKTNRRVILLGKLDSLSARVLTSCAYIKNINESTPLGIAKLDIVRLLDFYGKEKLFDISSEISSARQKSSDLQDYIDGIVDQIGIISNRCKSVNNWFYPTKMGACLINESRTVCRETEIAAWDASIGSEVPVYLNRLSDLLFYLSIYTEITIERE